MSPMMGGIMRGHMMPPPMLFLFLEKNYAFDWKDNFVLTKNKMGGVRHPP